MSSLRRVVRACQAVDARVMAEHAEVGPNPVLSRDLAALIGILVVLESQLWVGEVSDDLADSLRDRLVRVGLLSEGATRYDLRQVINDLNHRLRYAAGEYPEPPVSWPVPE
jgi:hypothetical protein